MSVDQAEALLAVVGLRRVLAGDAPGPEDLSRSLDLEKEVKRCVVRFLKGQRKHPDPVEDVPLPPTLPESSHEAVGDLDQEVAVSYGLAAARALHYLNTLIPERSLPGLRVKIADRTAQEKAAMRRALQVADEPLAVLGDLAAMSDDQIEALKSMFPTLWASLGLVVTEAMADVDKELSSREERILGRLMGVAVGDVESIQALYRQEKAEKQASGQAPDAPEMGTALQKIAAN